jgi:hypothetical protein
MKYQAFMGFLTAPRIIKFCLVFGRVGLIRNFKFESFRIRIVFLSFNMYLCAHHNL